MQDMISTKYKTTSGEEVEYPVIHAERMELAEKGAALLMSDYRKLFREVTMLKAEVAHLKQSLKN